MSAELIAKQAKLIKQVEAIDTLLQSDEWQVLRENVFDENVARIERILLAEAKSPEIDLKKIYLLQGELANAKRYDLATYAEKCKKELDGIKLKLQ
jgi:hypothetical protein